MPCFRPLKGFKGTNGGISWTPSMGFVDLPMEVPCGRCIGCRLERSRQWAVRMMHEAQMHEWNSFITLTYDDEHLPADGSLNKKHFQDFVKRLRARVAPVRFSYFHCGEYGDMNGRPHYHAILFGLDFADRKPCGSSPSGHGLFQSDLLDAVWGLGRCWVGNCTFESAAYCARYVLKKVTGQIADEHYKRVLASGEIVWLQPEYASMSNRPAIGMRWFEMYGGDVVAYDGCVVAGKLQKPPRYYDKLRGRDAMRGVKRERVFKALENYEHRTDARLKVREEFTRLKMALFAKRSI